MSRIGESELILNPDGSIYHLKLRPSELADNIIVVGDPGRVPAISKYFDRIETERQNREIVTHTGYIGNKRVTVLSTGMGTDNIDIVLNELDALANIDLEKREARPVHKSLNIVRLGTSGLFRQVYLSTLWLHLHMESDLMVCYIIIRDWRMLWNAI